MNDGPCRGFHDGKVAPVTPVTIEDGVGGTLTVGWLCGVCGKDRPGTVSEGWDGQTEHMKEHSLYFAVIDGVERQLTYEEFKELGF